jgi:hypothetical protein
MIPSVSTEMDAFRLLAPGYFIRDFPLGIAWSRSRLGSGIPEGTESNVLRINDELFSGRSSSIRIPIDGCAAHEPPPQSVYGLGFPRIAAVARAH